MKIKGEPKLVSSVELHIHVVTGEGEDYWYRWTSVGVNELRYYADKDGAKFLGNDPTVVEFKVVEVKRVVGRHWKR